MTKKNPLLALKQLLKENPQMINASTKEMGELKKSTKSADWSCCFQLAGRAARRRTRA